MNEKQLKIILEDHIKWLNGKGGKYANLSGAEIKFLEEIEEMRADAHSLYNENNKLKKELEVYKMALDLASQTILEMLGRPIVMGGVIASKLAFTPKDTEYFLEQARKELEDEKRS